jgi:hypothetical protein
MAFAQHDGGGRQGVHESDHGPFQRSLETAAMQGKRRGGPGAAPFGGRHQLVLPMSFHTRGKYCHNSGHDLRP